SSRSAPVADAKGAGAGVLIVRSACPGGSPAVVRERLVGLCHAVHVFLLAHGTTAVVRGLDQLVGELLEHAATAAGAGVLDEPADGQGLPTLGTHLDGHLVVRATHAAGLDLDAGLDVVDRIAEDGHRVLTRTLLDEI